MKKTVGSFLIILLFTNICFCQDSIPKMENAASEKEKIQALSENYSSSFKMKGYRIQIFSGNKKQPARNARSKFTTHFGDVRAHEIYQQPYFKIRVGDYRTKLEALKFQKKILEHFPNCFIVKDEIDVEELLK